MNSTEETLNVSEDKALEIIRGIRKRREREIENRKNDCQDILYKKQKLESIVSEACQKKMPNTMVQSVAAWEKFRQNSNFKDKMDSNRKHGFLAKTQFKYKTNEKVKSFMARKRTNVDYAQLDLQ